MLSRNPQTHWRIRLIYKAVAAWVRKREQISKIIFRGSYQDVAIQLDVTREEEDRSSWILSFGDWVSGAETSELGIRVKLPVSSRRKKSSVGMDSTCCHQGSCPAGNWYIYIYAWGERLELGDVDLRIVTSCGSDAITMCVIVQRVWSERTGLGQTPWDTSIHQAGRGRRAPWRQGKKNQKYTRNMQGDVLQDPRDQSLQKEVMTSTAYLVNPPMKKTKKLLRNID